MPGPGSTGLLKGLSRLRGNPPERFLEGLGLATASGYSTPGHWKVRIMLAKGKAPKVRIAVQKDGSRFVTFPRGDASQEAR